jgi:hypothetical protein
MPVSDEQEGHYRLFETTNGNWILVLDDDRWAAWVQGQAGEILVGTDEDHEKARTISAGEYMFLDFDDDPTFEDMPHLFLAGDDADRELILPNGWPDERDNPKKVIETGEPISIDELRSYLEGGPPGGKGGEWPERPGGGR